MENFAIDLDKVLDDFEFDEDENESSQYDKSTSGPRNLSNLSQPPIGLGAVGGWSEAVHDIPNGILPVGTRGKPDGHDAETLETSTRSLPDNLMTGSASPPFKHDIWSNLTKHDMADANVCSLMSNSNSTHGCQAQKGHCSLDVLPSDVPCHSYMFPSHDVQHPDILDVKQSSIDENNPRVSLTQQVFGERMSLEDNSSMSESNIEDYREVNPLDFPRESVLLPDLMFNNNNTSDRADNSLNLQRNVSEISDPAVVTENLLNRFHPNKPAIVLESQSINRIPEVANVHQSIEQSHCGWSDQIRNDNELGIIDNEEESNISDTNLQSSRHDSVVIASEQISISPRNLPDVSANCNEAIAPISVDKNCSIEEVIKFDSGLNISEEDLNAELVELEEEQARLQGAYSSSGFSVKQMEVSSVIVPVGLELINIEDNVDVSDPSQNPDLIGGIEIQAEKPNQISIQAELCEADHYSESQINTNNNGLNNLDLNLDNTELPILSSLQFVDVPNSDIASGTNLPEIVSQNDPPNKICEAEEDFSSESTGTDTVSSSSTLTENELVSSNPKVETSETLLPADVLSRDTPGSLVTAVYDDDNSSGLDGEVSQAGAEETSNLSRNSVDCLSSAIGIVAPFWIPDDEAPNCQECGVKFTVIRRRHHCRGCGRVLCAPCCHFKTPLPYMEYKEARVCNTCLTLLSGASSYEDGLTVEPGRPNPNNPMEYCSRIPPQQQIGPGGSSALPTVMVPIGVLKRENSATGTSSRGNKQVIFSDGIRPGGDLTELGGQARPSSPFRRTGRVTKRIPVNLPVFHWKMDSHKKLIRPEDVGLVETDAFLGPDGEPIQAHTLSPDLDQDLILDQSIRMLRQSPMMYWNISVGRVDSGARDTGIDSSGLSTRLSQSPSTCLFLPGGGLPPVVVQAPSSGEYVFDCKPDTTYLEENLRGDGPPVVFALQKNLHILVKLIKLDCCVGMEVWNVASRGLCNVGQEELVVLLEVIPGEKGPPAHLFAFFQTAYQQANKGNLVTELGHTIFTEPEGFLGSKDHGGFLYIRPSFQCLQKLVLPPAPYLFAVLIQKWETPWAKVFPLRLMLRLGAEFRYYPCPLVSNRNRKPVYCEIGHTIMNLLVDFRNYAYTVPAVQGFVIHMEDKKTSLLIPRNRYEQVWKALNNSNDHVLALGANFSPQSDSHLVTVEDDDGHYSTQAINIHNKPRKVTGASFIVFNGALKSSSGLKAKSSIVEDGLMVQIPGEMMYKLRDSLRNMKDFDIPCGPSSATEPDELVCIRWISDDKNYNIGIKSPIDEKQMDGISSVKIHSGTDYISSDHLIRWTEVFIIQGESSTSNNDININRLAEGLAQACCVALTPHLELLFGPGPNRLGLRATLHAENVGYEAGMGGSRLLPSCMKELDAELVPVIHRAAANITEEPIILELLFHIMEQ